MTGPLCVKWEGILCEPKWNKAVENLSRSNIGSLIALFRNIINSIQDVLQSKQLVATNLHIQSQAEHLDSELDHWAQ